MPKGYTVVSNGPFDAATGTQTHGSASCPGTKQPAGGGAFVENGDNVAASINSSYPDGQTWELDVNNTTGTETSFEVYVVCIAQSAGYKIATAAGVTGLGETDAAMDCPSGSKVIGGGVLSDTTNTGVNISTTTPYALGNGHSGWEVFMSSTGDVSNFTVYSICHHKPAGWSVATGSSVSIPAGEQAEAVVSCPGDSVPLGGGSITQFDESATTIDLNTDYPADNGWHIYESDGETTATSLTASTVCAGT